MTIIGLRTGTVKQRLVTFKEAWKLPATAIPCVKLSIIFANKLSRPTVFSYLNKIKCTVRN